MAVGGSIADKGWITFGALPSSTALGKQFTTYPSWGDSFIYDFKFPLHADKECNDANYIIESVDTILNPGGCWRRCIRTFRTQQCEEIESAINSAPCKLLKKGCTYTASTNSRNIYGWD